MQDRSSRVRWLVSLASDLIAVVKKILECRRVACEDHLKLPKALRAFDCQLLARLEMKGGDLDRQVWRFWTLTESVSMMLHCSHLNRIDCALCYAVLCCAVLYQINRVSKAHVTSNRSRRRHHQPDAHQQQSAKFASLPKSCAATSVSQISKKRSRATFLPL